MYYAKTGGRNASPLKIIIGDYEISMAGDDSCGALPVYSRLDIRVYRTDLDDCIEEMYSPEFSDLVNIVNKYRELSERELSEKEK